MTYQEEILQTDRLLKGTLSVSNALQYLRHRSLHMGFSLIVFSGGKRQEVRRIRIQALSIDPHTKQQIILVETGDVMPLHQTS